MCESEPDIVLPGTPKRCMCVGCETPLPGLEYHSPKRAHADRRKAWSSAFFSSACSRLWSTYCTETSVCARVEPEGLELLHHQRAGGVLGERLVDPDRDLLAGGHLPVDEVARDELLGDSVCH